MKEHTQFSPRGGKKRESRLLRRKKKTLKRKHRRKKGRGKDWKLRIRNEPGGWAEGRKMTGKSVRQKPMIREHHLHLLLMTGEKTSVDQKKGERA